MKVGHGTSAHQVKTFLNIFEVHSQPAQSVDILRRTCSCGGWQIHGFPCSHVAVVIHKSTLMTVRLLTDYIEEYFFVRFYEQCYSMSI